MNTGIRLIITAVIIAGIFSSSPVSATVLRSRMSLEIPASTTIDDDLAASGANLDIAGKVSGDAIVTGYQVALDGSTISGDVIAAGNQLTLNRTSARNSILAGSYVTVSGSTGHDLYLAGAWLTVSDKVADNAYLAGATVIVTNQTTVGRDLFAAGSNLSIDGHVGRNLQARGKMITLNGTVGGNAEMKGHDIRLGPNALVRGNLVYTSDQPARIASGARVLGKTIYRHEQYLPGARHSARGKLSLWLFSLISSFIVGVVILAISPLMASSIADKLASSPWRPMLTGLIIFAAVPAVGILLIFTIFGIPLALLMLAFYVISLYLSLIYAALAIGKWILNKTRRPSTSLYLDLLVGILILWILVTIPLIGWLIKLAAIFVGLGAFYSLRYQRMKGSDPIPFT